MKDEIELVTTGQRDLALTYHCFKLAVPFAIGSPLTFYKHVVIVLRLPRSNKE
jgi:hypothetical protein